MRAQHGGHSINKTDRPTSSKTKNNVVEQHNNNDEHKNKPKLTYRWPGLLQSDDAVRLESSSSSFDVGVGFGSPGDASFGFNVIVAMCPPLDPMVAISPVGGVSLGFICG